MTEVAMRETPWWRNLYCLAGGRMYFNWHDGHIRVAHSPEEFHATFIVGAKTADHDPGDEDQESR